MNSKRIEAEQTLYRTQQRIKKPDVYGHKKDKARMIRKELLTAEEEEDGIALQIPSDSVNAANYMIQLNNTHIPVCFIHQLYSILPNATLVDKELQEAIMEGQWRKFHMLGSLEEEYVIIKSTEYAKMINEAKSQFEKEVMDQKNNCSDKSIFDRFVSLISDKRYYGQVNISVKSLSEFGINDMAIKQLVMYGLLLPHLQVELYWFSIRNQGYFMANITRGREEILRILKKRATKDIMEKLLKLKKLRKSVLNMEFLLHDLVGSGRTERYNIQALPKRKKAF
ncbi:unnamed protein product [Rhizopus stolonifer]